MCQYSAAEAARAAAMLVGRIQPGILLLAPGGTGVATPSVLTVQAMGSRVASTLSKARLPPSPDMLV